MKLFSRFFARRETNMTTAMERQRLSRTMPGQTGAVAAARLGFVAPDALRQPLQLRRSIGAIGVPGGEQALGAALHSAVSHQAEANRPVGGLPRLMQLAKPAVVEQLGASP